MPVKHLQVYHLLNDYSGSPLVLSRLLRSMPDAEIDLHTTAGGPLDAVCSPGCRLHPYRYSFSRHGWLTMTRYAGVQARTFFRALLHPGPKDSIFYINTLLPMGPALAARLRGRRVVYHYHENAHAKGLVYKLLAKAMRRLAHRIICVSAYQASHLGRTEGVEVVPNALPAEMVARLHPDPEAAFTRRRVLMISSLKAYKGTREFVELARRLPDFKFTIVINDTPEAISAYFAQETLPPNLEVSPRVEDVTPFYNRSSVVLNLSNPRLAVETFGLTALEAMSAGLPVIVPETGGIAELVEEGRQGYHVDVRRLDEIASRISGLLSDRKLYLRLSAAALEHSHKYDAAAQSAAVNKLLNNL